MSKIQRNSNKLPQKKTPKRKVSLGQNHFHLSVNEQTSSKFHNSRENHHVLALPPNSEAHQTNHKLPSNFVREKSRFKNAFKKKMSLEARLYVEHQSLGKCQLNKAFSKREQIKSTETTKS